MFLAYERSLQPGLVGAGPIVPVRASLGAEILILRHQLNIQRRHLPKRLTLSAMDRLIVTSGVKLIKNHRFEIIEAAG